MGDSALSSDCSALALPADCAIADARWPLVTWSPGSEQWTLPPCGPAPNRRNTSGCYGGKKGADASCFYRGRCLRNQQRCECEPGFAGARCSEWPRRRSDAAEGEPPLEQWLLGWPVSIPEKVGATAYRRNPAELRVLETASNGGSGAPPGSRATLAMGPLPGVAQKCTGSCRTGYLDPGCYLVPTKPAKTPEIVRPSVYSRDIWKKTRGTAVALTEVPVHNITFAIQSAWNSAEGRELGQRGGDKGEITTQTSFPFAGFDVRKNGGVVTRVLASDAGIWSGSASCTTPKAWLFLFGHYRTFDFNRPSQAAAMELATGGCYFVCSAVWPEMAANSRHGSVRAMFPASSNRSRDAAKAMGAVNREHMLEAAGEFAGRMAFVILSRDFESMGHGKRSSFSTALPWHACWELARWAATTHGFAIEPHSTVIR